MNSKKPSTRFISLITILALFGVIFQVRCAPVLAAPTRFVSPNFGVESVIFGGTGTLRSAEASIPPLITTGPDVRNITTNSFTVTWTTDKPSNSVLSIGISSGAYTLQLGQLTDTSLTSHVVIANLLKKGTPYYFQVSSSDFAGNLSQSPENQVTTDPGDITPPKITSGPSVANASATSVIISWETDKISTSTIEYGIKSVSENPIGSTDSLTTFHQVVITGLLSAQTYQLRIKTKDASDNQLITPTQQFTTLNAPSITEVRITDITLNSALVQWKTTSTSTSSISYGSTAAYGQSVSSGEYTKNHFTQLTNLTSGTVYFLRLAGQDQSANRITSDEYTFKTVVLPIISDFVASAITASGVKLAWSSSSEIDEFATFTVKKNDDPRKVGQSFTVGNGDLVNRHAMSVDRLESDSDYAVSVIGKDLFGNQALSVSLTFHTLVDKIPPVISDVKTDTTVDLGSKQTVQVLISFSVSKPSKAVIKYGLGASGEFDHSVTTDTDFSTSKLLVMSDLQAGQSYHFIIDVHDKVGNEAKSADYLVLAPSQPVSLFDLIFKQIRDNFGFISGNTS